MQVTVSSATDELDTTNADASARDDPPSGRQRRLWAAPLAALTAGGCLLLAFPPYDLWWMAPVGVALLDLATRGRRTVAGAGLGGLCGAVFFVALLRWTGLHVGAFPWLLLAGLQAAYLALLGAAAAFIAPLSHRWHRVGPMLTALLWTAQEALRDRAPFGGFPWGRLAFSQAGSPLVRLAALGGAPLVTFAVALAGGLLAVAIAGAARAAAGRARRVAAAGAAVGAALLVAGCAMIPLTPPAGARLNVAIIQGNVPRLGLDFNEQRRAVLDNHVEATLDLARRVAAGTARQPDLVIWPENSSDIDPLVNTDAAQRIAAAADAIRAPLLVGSVLEGPGDNVRNAALVWLPATGVTDLYVKRHPVPFAEYVPMRSLARRVTTKVDLVGSDFIGGDRPGVLRVGPATVGDVICFEVAYDGLVRDTVTGGGQLLIVQTNNATFNPAESRQQLAMVRLRAVEHGRSALMASTVGVSGFVSADGALHDATAFNTRAVEARELSLGSARTLATRLGAAPECILTVAALVALGCAVRIRIRAGTTEQGEGANRMTQGEPTDPGRRRLAPHDNPDQPITGYPGVGRVLVVIPTYNEAENIQIIVERVRRAVPAAEVLIADDNSPDGTGDLADGLASADPNIHVLHRPGKQGLGAAYIAGFAWAREHEYDVVVEMDADGSHAPEELPRLLDAAREADVVLGSRWVKGGSVVNWPFHRLVLSRGGNLYTRLALGMPFRDATGGFRVYRLPVLDKIDVQSVSSQGYCFQVDLAWRAHRDGYRVVEVPITFAERERGASKMSSSIVREALWRVTVWGTRARLASARRAVTGRRRG